VSGNQHGRVRIRVGGGAAAIVVIDGGIGNCCWKNPSFLRFWFLRSVIITAATAEMREEMAGKMCVVTRNWYPDTARQESARHHARKDSKAAGNMVPGPPMKTGDGDDGGDDDIAVAAAFTLGEEEDVVADATGAMNWRRCK